MLKAVAVFRDHMVLRPGSAGLTGAGGCERGGL